jgi:hypothetical protein
MTKFGSAFMVDAEDVSMTVLGLAGSAQDPTRVLYPLPFLSAGSSELDGLVEWLAVRDGVGARPCGGEPLDDL